MCGHLRFNTWCFELAQDVQCVGPWFRLLWNYSRGMGVTFESEDWLWSLYPVPPTILEAGVCGQRLCNSVPDPIEIPETKVEGACDTNFAVHSETRNERSRVP